MKGGHVVRPADAAARAAVAQKKHAAAAQGLAVAYPAGFFCELIRRHNWPPSFESQLAVPGRRSAAAAELRAGGGYDAHPLNLPGAVQHLERAGKH
jgi:hypothetical protein